MKELVRSCRASRDAYLSPPKGASVIECPELRVRALVGRRRTLVAFRGSICAGHFARCLDPRMRRVAPLNAQYPEYVRIHAGVLDMFEALEPRLTRIIGEKSVDTVFAGHSLGGCLAALAAARYGGLCHTFGAPRVGDDAFTEWFLRAVGEERALHVANACDPVCRVPWQRGGYALTPGRVLVTRSHVNPVAAHAVESYLADIMLKAAESR